MKEWRKRNPDATLQRILDALAWQVASSEWTKEDGRYIPYPAKYLSHERWKDEPDNSTNGHHDATDCDPGLAESLYGT
jgi:hypothetical protein